MPLGRRLFLVVLLYGLALGVIALFGWRVADLVTSYRQAAVDLTHRDEGVAALSQASSRFQTALGTFAESRGEAIADEVDFQRGRITVALRDVVLEDEAGAQALSALTDALTDAMDKFQDLRTLNTRLSNTQSTIQDLAGQAMGLLAFVASEGTTRGVDLRPSLEAIVAQMEDFFIYQRMATANGALESLKGFRDQVNKVAFGTGAEDFRQALLLVDDRLASIRESLELQRNLADAWVGQSRFLAFISLQRVYDTTEALRGFAQERERMLRRDLEDRTGVAITVIVVLGTVILLVGFVANALVIQSIRTPLLSLNAIMQDMANGNWEREVEGRDAGDEVGAMARTLEVFKRNAARIRELEVDKREILAREKVETKRALAELDAAHLEIKALTGRLSTENPRLGAELDVSRRIQHMVLPRPEELARITALDVATCMEAADEVGGDYFDILEHDGGIRIGIGEVTGHGLESGVVMLLAQSAVRTLNERVNGLVDPGLPALVDALNRSLFGNIQRMGSGTNLTFALLDHTPRPDGRPGGVLRVTGQHESVIIVRADGMLEEVDTRMLGMPLGLVDNLAQSLAEETLDLASGDLVVLYTDGVTEAVNERDQLYGLERLKQVCQIHHRASALEVKNAVIADLHAHIGACKVLDDLTLIVMKQR
ncbi:MAG: PP2C family protein-serine/threonine phosphatase [Rhodospirillum sp.]|nr:PP2C family protein-serine/threonine phosphatase [Rhodospirillum sp.]MCF8491166.1 PP2C family protein-serine/threonine phosphatase [Rhodospirillum sp.]